MAKQLNVNLAVTANTQQAKQQLQSLQQTLSQLTTNSANLKVGLDTHQLQQASQQLIELQAHLKAATNIDTGTLDFTKLNNSIRNSGKTLTQYGQQLLSLGPQGQQAFAQLAQSVAQSEVPMRRLSGLLGQFGTVLKNTIRWQISSSLIHGFMGSIQQAYGYAQDLNKSLNNIQIVTGLSDNQMAKFAKTANTAAKALSTTTTKYTDAALIYYQQGIRSEKEITERTNATIKMANVTGQSTEAVSNQMTAIWNNFADGSKNLEYYADVITALGAATASSSEEISQGLQKFAAVADTVGLSYENATAALATITATTRQSADTVGTGLRTLFSRLQGLSLGQTLEDGVNLTKYSKALATVGVNALDAQGQLRNMDDVLNDLGNKWQSLSKAQQVALAQTVGGVRQYTNLIALMDNFDFYQQNVDIAKKSEGTLQRQQAIYEKSWEASSKRVKAAAETIYSSLLNDQFFIKLNNGFAGLLDIINQIITGLGGMKGILLTLGGVMTNVFSGQIAQGLYNFGVGIKNITQTPSRQRDARTAFINNAAGLMAGGTYDANTKTVTNIPNNNGPFSLVGQYTALLQHQAAFTGNAQYMTPQQKQMAQMALDNENKAYLDYQQKRIAQQRNDAIWYDREGAIRAQAQRSAHWDEGVFNRAEAGFNGASDLYNRRMNMINRLREGGTVDGMSQDDITMLATLGINTRDIQNWNGDNLNSALNQAERTANRVINTRQESFVRQMANLDVNREDALAYANIYRTRGQGNFEAINSRRNAEAARENSQRLAGLSSTGLRITTGMTNIAAGVMQATAASTQLEQAIKTMEQFRAGTLSTKDTINQMMTSISGLGMNGIMAFQSMTKAVEAFGVKSAAAAGWIGLALTALTIALPKIIESIDRAVTTPEEVLENLHAGTESAQQAAIEAKTAYDNLINGFSQHSTLLDTLNELTAGTLEFQQALLEANNAAYKLINDNNLSPDDWFINERGAVQIKAGVYDRLQREALQKQQQATAESYAAKSLDSYKTTSTQTIQEAQKIYDDILHKNELQELETATSISPSNLSERIQLKNNTKRYDQLFAEQQAALSDMTNDQYWSNLKRFATQNGLNYTDLSTSLQNGTWAQNSLLRAGASNDALIAMTNARLSSTERQTLSTTEQILAGALSSNPEVLDTIFNNATQNKEYYPLRTAPNGGFKHYGDTAKTINLTSQDIETLGPEEIKSLYLQNALGDNVASQYEALLKDLDKQGITNQAERNVAIATKLRNQLAANEYATTFDKAYKEIDTITQKQIDNWKDLNYEQILQLGAKLAAGNETEQLLAEGIYNLPNQIEAEFLQAAHASIQDNETYKKFIDSTEQLAEKDKEAVTNLRTQYLNAYGEETGNLVFQKVTEDLKQGSDTLRNIFTDFQSSGSIITDLANIRSGQSRLGTYNAENKELLATQVYDSIIATAGEKGLFEELYNSDDFAEGLKALHKELKKTGKIGADSLVALTEQSELLSDYFEASTINAQGLADALNLLETGQINNVSNALLKALSAAGEVNSNLQETYSYIDNFKEERSIQDIGVFMKKRADVVQAGFSSGMLLDAPLLQSMEALFGTDIRSQYQKDIYDWTGDQNLTPEQISKLVNDKYADQIAAMKSIQERGNLSGMFEYYEQQNPNGGMFSYNQQTGQVTAIDRDQLIKNGWQSQDAFIQGLQDNYGMSETMARAMASEYAATNGNIAQLWRETATQNGISELLSTENGELLTGTDARAFYKQYKDIIDEMYGFDSKTGEESFLAKMAQDAKAAGKEFIDLGNDFDFSKDKFTDFQDAYNKSRNKQEGTKDQDWLTTDWTKAGIIEKNSTIENGQVKALRTNLDFSKGITELQKYGATLEQAYEYMNQLQAAETEATGQTAYFSKEITKADGSIEKINSSQKNFVEWQQKNGTGNLAKDFDNYSQSIQASEDALAAANEQVDIIAQGIQKAFSEDNPITVTFDKPDTSPITDAIQEVSGQTISVHISATPDTITISANASGYNNIRFAGGKHSNGQYEGLAEVGELGPELFIHDGQPYLAGIHGRTKAYVHPNDQIYTAAQTQKILDENPSLQDIPGFSVGYNQVTWGSKSNANADNAKTSKWEPERYHLITRQIKDLQREYDRLNKIREKTFGADKLKALDQEIEATNELIEGQKRLIQEAEDYLKIDTERVIKLLAPGEFQVDANGNLANFEELQQKYRKKAEEDKDENAQTIWKALMQYEETIDKVHDAQTELQELMYQLQDLALEQITIKIELELDISDDRFEYLDYLLDKIDDDAYQTAEAIALLGEKTAETMKKINTYTDGLGEILSRHGFSLTDLNNLSVEDLQNAGFTQDEIDQIKEWRSELLTANKDLLEIRKTIVEKVISALNDLNEKVQKSYDKFDAYNSVLEKYKNITDLMGRNMSAQSRQIMNQLSNTMLRNAQNTAAAARRIYEDAEMEMAQAQLAYQLAVSSGDQEAIRRWQEVIDATSEHLQEAEAQWLDSWNNALEQAKTLFEDTMEQIQEDYNTIMGNTFGSLDYLQAAYDRQKEIGEMYERDFDRLYNLSKLSRDISKAIDDNDNIQGKQKLRALQAEINKLQADGTRLSEYDVEVLRKKFELEQARLALDDAQNAKSQVRLQRDANGNWGYVYTANEDKIAEAEQAYEDKLHEYQVLNDDYINKLQNKALEVQQTWSEIVGEIYSDLGLGVITDEEAATRLAEANQWLNEQRAYFEEQSNHALENQASLYDRTLNTYHVASAEIVDTWDETNLALLTKIDELQVYMDNWNEASETFLNHSAEVIDKYKEDIDKINDMAGISTTKFENHIDNVVVNINDMSDDTLTSVNDLSETMRNEFSSALSEAVNWELQYVDAMDAMINRNETFVKSLNLMIEKLAGVNTSITEMLTPLETLDNIINQSTTPVYYQNSLSELTGTSAQHILSLLNANIAAYSAGLGELSMSGVNGLTTTIDQNVTINAAFPNATNHSEIEEAFTNLINKASQYANRKGL